MEATGYLYRLNLNVEGAGGGRLVVFHTLAKNRVIGVDLAVPLPQSTMARSYRSQILSDLI